MSPGSSVARRAAAGRLHFNRCPSRSWAGWRRLDAASFVDAAGAEAARAPAARARRSPAHDLVGQQHAAHLRVLVLALVDDGLRGGQAEAGVTRRPRLGGPVAPGAAGGRCTAGRGRRRGPPRPPSRGSHPGAGQGQGGLLSRALAGPARGLRLGRARASRAGGRGWAARGRPRPGRRERGRSGTHPAARGCQPSRPPSPPPPGRVLGPLSTPSSDLRVGRGRSEPLWLEKQGRAAGAAVRLVPRAAPALPCALPGLGKSGARLLPAFHSRCLQWAALRTGPRPGSACRGRPRGRDAAAARGRAAPGP